MNNAVILASSTPMRFFIGDTETTGLPPCKACEIGLIEIDENFNVIQKIESLIDPEMTISEGAINVHGITNEMVADAPTTEEFITHILQGTFEGTVCLICHNRKFDVPMLSHIGDVTHGICTLELARSLPIGAANNQLQTLRRHYGIEETTAHRAMGDCEVTLELLKHLLKATGKTLAETARKIPNIHLRKTT